jgi:hypothetical protein
MKLQLRFGLRWLAIAGLAAAPPAGAAPFTSSGNLVVVRLDGAGLARAVHLDEYDVSGAAGVFVQNIDLPASGGGSLAMPSTANHDGLLNRSIDGRFLMLTGYGTDAGGATDPSTLAAATTPRVVGVVNGGGVVNTTTRLSGSFDATSVRAAVSVDGSSFWVAGDNAGGATPTGGLRYVGSLGSSTSVDLSQVQATGSAKTPDNVRSVSIFGGQLYDSSGSNASLGKNVFKVGTGLPTSGAQTATAVTSDTNSVNSFFFADLDAGVAGLDTLYTSTGTAIRKFALVGGVWAAKGTFTPAVNDGSEFEAMTASVSGSSVTIYASNLSTVQRLTDASGYNGTLSGTPSIIVTAGAGTAFRGLAFAPNVPEPASVGLAGVSVLAILAARRRRAG